MIESLPGAPILRFGRGASSKLAVETAGLVTDDELWRGAGGASGATHPAMTPTKQRQAKRIIKVAHTLDEPLRMW